jgi:ATP-dependent helicase/nuclease subunit A
MGAYHAGLTAVFPDHEIEVAILWTETANLMPLENDLVSAALNRVTVP